MKGKTMNEEMEYDREVFVWAMTRDAALKFFGLDEERHVIRDATEEFTDERRERYHPKARCFAISKREVTS